MPEFKTQHHVGHSADNMFRLVADVERYPEFVPLCTALTITSRTKTETGETLVATMGVGHKALKDTFTTQVLLDAATRTITVSYIDGPFRHLENRWHFAPLEPSGCLVDFYIAYEFRSPLLAIALGPLFDTAFRRFTTAFEQRADEIYGRPAGATNQEQV